MSGPAQISQAESAYAASFGLRVAMVVLVLIAAFGLARLLVSAPLELGIVAGTGAVLAALGLWGLRQMALAQLIALISDDPDPVVISNADGIILGRSAPFENLAEAQAGRPILQLFARRIAEPEAVFLRLTSRLARDGGTVQERLSLGDKAGVIILIRAGSWLVWRLRPDAAVTADTADSSDSLPVALMRFHADGRMVSANRAARALAGLAPDAMPQAHELFEDLGRPVTDWLADVAHGRHPGGAEMLRLRGGDQDTFFQATVAPVTTAQAGSDVMVVLSDASALKRLEAQFNQSQKMQAVGQLAGGIAHDFNNLLTAISGHCDLLMLRHNPDDSTFPDLVQIRQNANRAAALVGQLLAFSRKQTLKPERLELVEVLGDLGHLLSRLVGERVRLVVEHGRAIGPIRVDKRQFEQVIMNLVVNARDAMPEGGTVQVKTRSETLTEPFGIGPAEVPPGRYSVIHVIDGGIGIPPDRIGKIFDPFFTTKRAGEGTGLGLSMVYGIVKQSGGFIFVDSTVGEGTHFQLWFPVHTGTEVEVTTTPTPAARPMRSGNAVVLLVEDEAPVRAFASRALRLRGHTVLEAASGEEALAILDDPALSVDIFVSDVIMPGLDGPTWVRNALENRPQVRVVFTSGYAEESVAESHLRIPGSVFLPKPFSLNDLTEAVAKLVAA